MVKIEKDHQTKVLYVEDDPDIRENIEKLLKRRYEKVEVCVDGLEGLERFKEFQPNIIITDVLMPRMSGLSMSEEIRKIDNEVPIIVTTAHSDSDHLIKAIDIGITHYVVKPIDLKLLFGYLDKFKKQFFIEKELEETRELFESITTTSVSGIFVFNEKFTYTNPEFQKITGFSEEELLNKSFHEIFACQYQEKANGIVQLVKEHKKLDDNFFEGKISTKDGLEKWVHASVNTIKHKDDFIGTGSIIDISELKNLQEKLTKQANYDNLTKAINRHYFVEIYKHEAIRSDRSQQPISLIMLDIDHFKLVNDNYGHNIGDYILREMTNKVTSTLRDSDSFIRWGGEEFIIFAPETDLEGASNIAEKVRKSIEEYPFKDVEKITISLGVVMRKVDESLETLVERADKNLYKAKETGRNRVVSE